MSLKFKKKPVAPVTPPPPPASIKGRRYPAEIKQRAFELFMRMDIMSLAREYSMKQIVEILKKEFKGTSENVGVISQQLIAHWIDTYGWRGYYAAAIEKSKTMVDKELTQGEAYEQITANLKASTVGVDKLIAEIDKKTAIAQQIDKLAPVAATIIADLFMLNQAHFKNLMAKRSGAWVYDCDKDKARTQLFDMWLAGTNKLLEIYNLTPPKRTSTKATITNKDGNQEIDIDSTELSNVKLSADNTELILRLFGIEQVKGGFGNELPGPDNADFPSKPGTAGPIEPSKTSTDS